MSQPLPVARSATRWWAYTSRPRPLLSRRPDAVNASRQDCSSPSRRLDTVASSRKDRTRPTTSGGVRLVRWSCRHWMA